MRTAGAEPLPRGAAQFIPTDVNLVVSERFRPYVRRYAADEVTLVHFETVSSQSKARGAKAGGMRAKDRSFGGRGRNTENQRGACGGVEIAPRTER